ncbi:hypothetical protein Cgig2_021459 [Carnegiea gigantea]|uniref:Uncharacterized protein n=1 Tax=Carnegiea gigantea TaxID=171969 RepID=A0A9Q1JJW7_9CARY|nr:hypothetical protein Cgig2_021459 [Carnegiea gigantea]
MDREFTTSSEERSPSTESSHDVTLNLEVGRNLKEAERKDGQQGILETYASIVNMDEGQELSYIPCSDINGTKYDQIKMEDIRSKLEFCENVMFPRLDVNYWSANVIQQLLIWVQFPRLDVKYLSATARSGNRGELPKLVGFMKEHGILMQQEVKYEWRPIRYTRGNLFGHNVKDCMK